MDDNRIEIYRGDSSVIDVACKDSSGSAFDLTGYSAKLTIKVNKNAANHVLQINGIVSEPATAGHVTFSITKLNSDLPPKSYVYDVQITSFDGNTVLTVVDSEFVILRDITI